MSSGIALVVLYFGKLPEIFPVWLKSFATNDTIDCFLFTDDRRTFDYPPNVKVHYVAYEEMLETIQRTYDFKISVSSPYRLCDFKPAFGEIFAEYLTAYDYWGYCDVDMMFGDIRSLVTEELLDEYPKILSRGHFTLIRNTPEFTTLYRRTLGGVDLYKEVFTSDSPDLLGFEEWDGPGINDICAEHGVPVYDEIIMSDIYIGRHGLYPVQLMKAEPDKKNNIYLWDQGTLTRFYLQNGELKSNETLYLHLQKRNMVIEPGVETSERVLVVPNRFVPFDDGTVDVELLEQLGRDRLVYPDYWRIRLGRARMKFRRAVGR